MKEFCGKYYDLGWKSGTPIYIVKHPNGTAYHTNGKFYSIGKGVKNPHMLFTETEGNFAIQSLKALETDNNEYTLFQVGVQK